MIAVKDMLGNLLLNIRSNLLGKQTINLTRNTAVFQIWQLFLCFHINIIYQESVKIYCITKFSLCCVFLYVVVDLLKHFTIKAMHIR